MSLTRLFFNHALLGILVSVVYVPAGVVILSPLARITVLLLMGGMVGYAATLLFWCIFAVPAAVVAHLMRSRYESLKHISPLRISFLVTICVIFALPFLFKKPDYSSFFITFFIDPLLILAVTFGDARPGIGDIVRDILRVCSVAGCAAFVGSFWRKRTVPTNA